MNDPKYWLYDLETLPNMYSAGFKNAATGVRYIFEMSEWEDHGQFYWDFLHERMRDGSVLIGFNNLRFDSVVQQEFLNLGKHRPVTFTDLFNKAQRIIGAARNDWSQSIWESDQMIPQIDFFALRGHGNFAKSVSLKFLEGYLRMPNIVEMKFTGNPITLSERKPTLDYMMHDINATEVYARQNWADVEFRLALDQQLGGRTRVNQPDIKLGQRYILDKLQARGVQIKANGKKIQSPSRDGVVVADILPQIQFDTPDLQRIYAEFQQMVVMPDEIKGTFNNMHATVGGMEMTFGMGGLHGALPSTTARAGDGRVIQLHDVVSYYPNLCIKGHSHPPEHFGEAFRQIYEELFEERKRHPKGSVENESIKLSLNSTFGSAGSIYSEYYSPRFLLSTTINGQLLLAKLAEVLAAHPEVRLLQVNTDGVAFDCPEHAVEYTDAVAQWWQDWTRLSLGVEHYDLLAQRDVNSYIAVEPSGAVKRKGAYSFQPQPHQDHSHLVVQKAVSAYVVDGVPLMNTIYNHTDPYDFCLTVKIKRSDTLLWGDEETQKVCRYYIAKPNGGGDSLTKVMPPLAGQIEPRRIGIQIGHEVWLANDMTDFRWGKLNHYWYYKEAKKLLEGLGVVMCYNAT